PPDLGAKIKALLAELKAGHTVPGAPIPAMFRDSVQPYMISWFRYDPAVEITRIKAPVLILQGDTDIQVGVEEAKILKAARPDATLVVLPG
ncbi:alpha/beta fold hydrolase, partial [Klebsiella pneumoniae]